MNYEKKKRDLQLNSSLYIYTVTTVYTSYFKKDIIVKHVGR